MTKTTYDQLERGIRLLAAKMIRNDVSGAYSQQVAQLVTKLDEAANLPAPNRLAVITGVFGKLQKIQQQRHI